jgi:hypothetical protein
MLGRAGTMHPRFILTKYHTLRDLIIGVVVDRKLA